MDIIVVIGKSIVKERKQKGITQEWLALNADLSVTHLRRIEHGTANPYVQTLEAIADVLGIKLYSLFVIQEDME